MVMTMVVDRNVLLERPRSQGDLEEILGIKRSTTNDVGSDVLGCQRQVLYLMKETH